jgi:hypothetical protein
VRANDRQSHIRVLSLLIAALAAGSCGPGVSKQPPNSKATQYETMPSRPISDVLKSHTSELMAIPGVSGTGEGASGGRPVILVLVARRTPELEARVPREIEGYSVEIRVVGEVRKLGGKR